MPRRRRGSRATAGAAAPPTPTARAARAWGRPRRRRSSPPAGPPRRSAPPTAPRSAPERVEAHLHAVAKGAALAPWRVRLVERLPVGGARVLRALEGDQQVAAQRVVL